MNWYWVYPYSDAPLLQSIIQNEETVFNDIQELNYNLNNQLQFIMPTKALRKAKRLVLYPDELYKETRNTWMKRHEWEMKPRISLPWNPNTYLTNVTIV